MLTAFRCYQFSTKNAILDVTLDVTLLPVDPIDMYKANKTFEVLVQLIVLLKKCLLILKFTERSILKSLECKNWKQLLKETLIKLIEYITYIIYIIYISIYLFCGFNR